MINPFTYGNPISDPARFFGRQHEVEQIFSRLRNLEFESSSIVGERRVGKTSLLNYVAHPDVRRSHGLDPNTYLFVYVDLEMVDGETTPTKLWKRLLRQLARSCYNVEVKQILEETYQAQSIDNFALADVFDIIDENKQYVVFLLDEFENVTANQNFDPAFFYGLRSLAIHHNLSLITSSRNELIDLCHSEAIRSSPFFNIFANINVPLFTRDEATTLISKLLATTEVYFTETELENIFSLAGYHPYFLQAASHFLFEAYSKNLGPVERMAFLGRAFRQEAAPHFDDYWHNANEQEKIVLTALSLLKQQQKKVGKLSFSLEQLQALYTRSDQTLARLEKHGLVTHEADAYSLVNVSLGEWIIHGITDTAHDQQSYEEWLQSSKSAIDRLSTKVKNDLGDVLPQISSKYRDLIITWASDPKNLLLVVGLFKTALGLG